MISIFLDFISLIALVNQFLLGQASLSIKAKKSELNFFAATFLFFGHIDLF